MTNILQVYRREIRGINAPPNGGQAWFAIAERRICWTASLTITEVSTPQRGVIRLFVELADVERRSPGCNLVPQGAQERVVDAPRARDEAIRTFGQFQVLTGLHSHGIEYTNWICDLALGGLTRARFFIGMWEVSIEWTTSPWPTGLPRYARNDSVTRVGTRQGPGGDCSRAALQVAALIVRLLRFRAMRRPGGSISVIELHMVRYQQTQRNDKYL